MRGNDIAWRLKRVNDEFHKQANNDLQENNLTYSQLRVLLYLLFKDDGTCTASLKELERNFEVAQATMAGIATRLEAKHFVESAVDSADRRIKKIHLTAEGKNVLQIHKESLDHVNDQLLKGLSEQDIDTLMYCLDAIYSNISGLDEGKKGDSK